MKKFYTILSFVLLSIVFLNSCRNPAFNINVLFDAEVIKYKATLILKDANGQTLPNNIAVSITGADAGGIYDFSGTKAIYAPAGVITLGVGPKDVPTGSKELSFNVIIKAPGYDEKNIPVTIAVNQFSQIINVTLLKTIAPTAASTVVSKEIALAANGATTAPVSFSTPTSSTVATTTTISIPAGTQFKDAAGNTLIGGTVTAQAVNFDPSDPLALSLFPGGKLSSSNVVGPNGTTSEAFFLPAGFADINMYVGGVAVKNFTTPINISIQLDPSFVPQATGVPLAVGNSLGIYSYQTSTGQFRFESNGTVILDANGKLAIDFTTNHLTTFIVGEVITIPASCKSPVATYSAAWLGVGTQPLTVEILDFSGTKVLASSTVQVSDGKVDPIVGLPPMAVRYRVSTIGTQTTPSQVLSEGAIGDPCAGENITITVGSPSGPPVENFSLLLNVNCPGKGTIIVPNFDVFYKPVGAPASAYALLGTAEKGVLKTTLLKLNSTYDFRATWGNQIKEVKNRTINSLDASVVVGENDFLGDKSPQANKALLIEACKNF